jgi:hypothetical protein
VGAFELPDCLYYIGTNSNDLDFLDGFLDKGCSTLQKAMFQKKASFRHTNRTQREMMSMGHSAKKEILAIGSPVTELHQLLSN